MYYDVLHSLFVIYDTNKKKKIVYVQVILNTFQNENFIALISRDYGYGI
jgi:hypothetical protein